MLTSVQTKPTTVTAMQHAKTRTAVLLVIVMSATEERGQPAAVSISDDCFAVLCCAMLRMCKACHHFFFALKNCFVPGALPTIVFLELWLVHMQ